MVGSDRYNGKSVFQAKCGNLNFFFNLCLTFYRSWKRAKTSQKESWRRKDYQRHSQLFFILNLHLINMLYSRTHNQLILKDWKFSYMLDKKVKKKKYFYHFCFHYNIKAVFICDLEFQGIDDIDLEDDKREIIHREIKSFRDLHKVGISVD